MFGFGRRRSFDRNNNNDQNSTGYKEKTVFSTDFGAPDNAGFGEGGYAPQNNAYDGGYAQNSAPQNGGYAFSGAAPQNNGYAGAYAQSGANGSTATEVRELPMVFASRKHSDIYIYEYTDRLEYYLRTDSSMYLFDTVKKQ